MYSWSHPNGRLDFFKFCSVLAGTNDSLLITISGILSRSFFWLCFEMQWCRICSCQFHLHSLVWEQTATSGSELGSNSAVFQYMCLILCFFFTSLPQSNPNLHFDDTWQTRTMHTLQATILVKCCPPLNVFCSSNRGPLQDLLKNFNQ